jgi:hypothetical protein
MEPSWTKTVTSRTVCDFFYILFWARVISAVILFVLILFTISIAKKNAGYEFYTMLSTQVLVLSIVIVDALFTYLVCERALIGDEKKTRVAA